MKTVREKLLENRIAHLEKILNYKSKKLESKSTKFESDDYDDDDEYDENIAMYEALAKKCGFEDINREQYSTFYYAYPFRKVNGIPLTLWLDPDTNGIWVNFDPDDLINSRVKEDGLDEDEFEEDLIMAFQKVVSGDNISNASIITPAKVNKWFRNVSRAIEDVAYDRHEVDDVSRYFK